MASRSNPIFCWHRKALLLTLVCLWLSFPYATDVSAEPAEPYAEGLLWSLQREGQANSFLFGTMHTGDPRVLALSEPVTAAMDQAEQFIMEVKLDSMTVLASLANLWLLDGQTLRQVIGESVYQDLQQAAAQAGIPESTLTYMKPWVVMILFSLPPGDYSEILDTRLMQMALAQGKPVLGLESASEQFDVFDGMPLDQQVALLQSTLKQYKALPTQFQALLEAYLAKDLAGMQALGQQQLADTPTELVDTLMFRLLEQRNQRMLDRLLPLLEQRSAFIAVGALHLPGDDGLLAMLAQQGYEIRRLD